MNWINHPLLTRVVRVMLLLAAAVHPCLVLFISLRRLAYPYELEWMEGGVVDHVMRILAGKPLYVEPSLEFVPFIYPPLYYYLGALLSKIIGIGFLPLRLISLTSALGCFAVILALVRRETHSSAAGFLAGCAYFAAFQNSSSWFDVGRVDSLFLFLVLAGVFVFRLERGAWSPVLAAILFFLAFLTKQTALLIAIPLILFSLAFLPPRRGFIFPVVFLGLSGLATLGFNQASGGWFNYYVFELPRQHNLERYFIKRFWSLDLLRPFAVACVLSGLFLAGCCRHRRFRDAAFFILLAGGMIGAAWLSRIHRGGFNNVLLPAYAALAILFGLGLAMALPRVLPVRGGAGMPLQHGPIFEFILAGLCILQFMHLYYSVDLCLPKESDRQAGEAFIGRLRAVKGDVYLASHGYLPVLAGKPSHAHSMALIDVMRGHDGALAGKLTKELHDAYASRRFGMVIFDGPWLTDGMAGNYVEQGRVFDRPEVFYPFAGARFRPENIYVPVK